MKYPTKKIRQPDVECIICKGKMRNYHWTDLMFDEEVNICSDVWCSDKCYKKFLKQIGETDEI